MKLSQNGEPTAILQHIESYEQMQESIALLKILVLGNRQVEEGRTYAATEVFKQLRYKIDIKSNPTAKPS